MPHVTAEQLIDCYAFNATEGEVEYWQKKESSGLELMNKQGFKPVLVGE